MPLSKINNSSTEGVITAGTAVASTSGTSIDFTSIPSWVKRVTVMFNGVSTNSTSGILIQLGSTTIQTSSYVATGSIINGTAAGTANYTTGFGLANGTVATASWSGQMVICNVSGNIWCQSHACSRDTGAAGFGGGVVTLAGTLDRLRLTTSNGTDTFDAGSINILYE